MSRTWLRRASLGAALALAAATGPARVTAAPRPLLPNLVPLRSVELLVGGVEPDGSGVSACQPGEVADDTPSPRRCLRFETRAANTGAGPLELRHRADQLLASSQVLQRVYASDGSHRDVVAGSFVLDPTHGHFHYEDFAVAHLWRSDANGRRLGKQPVRSGSKVGFCLMDVYAYRATAAKAAYEGPHACYPVHTADVVPSQVSGISPGWVDYYDVDTPHQYLEITGVPDGHYLLQVVLDPLGRLREETAKDNAVWHRVRLCAGAADLVGRTNRCG